MRRGRAAAVAGYRSELRGETFHTRQGREDGREGERAPGASCGAARAVSRALPRLLPPCRTPEERADSEIALDGTETSALRFMPDEEIERRRYGSQGTVVPLHEHMQMQGELSNGLLALQPWSNRT